MPNVGEDALERLRPRLVRLAVLMVDDLAAAEDLVQDVFTRHAADERLSEDRLAELVLHSGRRGGVSRLLHRLHDTDVRDAPAMTAEQRQLWRAVSVMSPAEREKLVRTHFLEPLPEGASTADHALRGAMWARVAHLHDDLLAEEPLAGGRSVWPTVVLAGVTALGLVVAAVSFLGRDGQRRAVPPPPPPTSVARTVAAVPEQLEVLDWQLEAISGVQELPPGSGGSIAFAGDAVSGNDTCNFFRGRATFAGSAVLIELVSATTISCPGTYDAAFRRALRNVESWSVVDGRLQLYGSSGTLVFSRHSRSFRAITLHTGTHQGGTYRLGYQRSAEGVVLSLDWDGPGTGLRSSLGLAWDEPVTLSAECLRAGSMVYVFGFVDARATRVSSGGSVLGLYPLPLGPQAYGGFVTAGASVSVVSRDSAGRVFTSVTRPCT